MVPNTNPMRTPYPKGRLLHNRYRILEPLGRGGLGFTYAAQDLQTKQSVAVKILSLRRAADWKKLELFEREAKLLEQLNHPAIPRYIDYFQIDTEHDRSFYIVQQLAPGYPLSHWVEEGWRPDTQAVKKIASQLLEILIYLQSHLPPVIHRDIKPQNIIFDNTDQLFLVDFGSVQATYRQSIAHGSTVVGTFGYMAPEQFRSQAVPATDLYGLGATLLFLLTGQTPADLPQRQLKIQFRLALPQLDPHFADWLERLLEPNPERRFTTAQIALDVLHRKQPIPPLPAIQLKPLGSPIQLHKTQDTLRVKIPAIGFRTPQIQRFAIANLIWNGSLGFVVIMIVSLQLFLAPGKLFSFGALIAAGLYLLVKYIYGALRITQIEFDRRANTIKLEQRLLGSRYKQINVRLMKSTVQVKQQKFWPWRQVPFTYCTVQQQSTPFTLTYSRAYLRPQCCDFGGFLTVMETNWLSQEINDFIGPQDTTH